MKPSHWPVWLLIALGIVAIGAGGLGIIYAPPAVAKVFWSIITIVGLLSLLSGVRRIQTRKLSR